MEMQRRRPLCTQFLVHSHPDLIASICNSTNAMKLLSVLLCAFSVVNIFAETQITWKLQQLHGDFYSEGAAIGDINGEANPRWSPAPSGGKARPLRKSTRTTSRRHSASMAIRTTSSPTSTTSTRTKKNDILILGFPGKEARLYLNPITHDDKSWAATSSRAMRQSA